MARFFSLGIVSLLLVIGVSATVMAQDTWQDYPDTFERGPGGYLAWWKLLVYWLVFLFWVRTTDWVNRDAQLLNLNHALWNPVNFFPFFAGLLILGLSFPFPVGCAIVVVAWIGPLFAYIFHRNSNVEDFEKVLTVDHFRHLAAQAGGLMGMEVDTQKKAPHEKGAPVTFKGGSGSASKDEANLILARQNDGFVAAKGVVADAFDRRGTKVMLETEPEQVTVRYQIDGVWHEADPLEREEGDPVIEVFKRVANCNPEEQRKRQTGEFAIAYQDHKSRVSLVAQGTKTGERTILNMITDGLAFDSLEEAGMRPGMQDQLKQLLAEPEGILLFTSVPAGGLSTTVALAGKMTDRYLRDFTSFQDVNNPEPVAENVTIETFDAKRDDTKESLQTVFRKDPDVIFVHDLPNKEIADTICEFASEKKLIVTTIRAKEAVEALLRVLLLKVPASAFVPHALGVVNQRLIRKLCEECKEEYTPTVELRKKLKLPRDSVEVLYRAPTPDEDEPICKACGGIGYVGRTSIFELVKVDDTLREALTKQPKLEVLRKVAKKAGNATLQEEGILLVAHGITSLQELQRVLKI